MTINGTGLFISLSILLSSCMTAPDPVHYLITGTYTGGKSEGIYVYEFNSANGDFKAVSHKKIANPSYLTVSPDEKFVYAVSENGNNGNGGEVSAFAFHKKEGILTAINTQLSHGDAPCYVHTDKSGKWVAVGNYSNGTLSVLPVNKDGQLDSAKITLQHTGTGVNKERQSGPHVHCTVFSEDGKWLFVPDLGIDKVMIYAFDATTGDLTPAPQPYVKTQDGSGPRHLTFHPTNKYAYLIEEMGGAVDVYDYANGTLHPIQRIASVQDNDSGFVGSADIHVTADGQFLYATNRGGFNSIAIYKINQDNGKLALVGHQPSLGDFPRNFTIDPSGNYLLVANQKSDNIVIFKRDRVTGMLTDTGKRIEVGNPVCLQWIGKD